MRQRTGSPKCPGKSIPSRGSKQCKGFVLHGGASVLLPRSCTHLSCVCLHSCTIGPLKSPLKTFFSLFEGLCLAFVESNFNLSKVNENADGSFDYGIFQINSHYWCNDYKSHSENICHEDCKELLSPDLLSTINCVKKMVSGAGGMKNWVAWRLHCAGRPLSYWMTGCHKE
uniref:Glycosyl hydrolases family 22 (GH22) domain-containing protein n=1 Tax=Felis catus TaxID=9685 RepID=A0ABI7XXM1_FELCA